jgi:hypothetical protein
VGLFYSNGKSIWYQAHPPYQSGAIPLYAAPQDVDTLLEKIDVLQQNLEMTTAAYVTHPAPVPAGWQLVPVEPTERQWEEGKIMLSAMLECGTALDIGIIYKAMLAAAPKPGESHD